MRTFFITVILFCFDSTKSQDIGCGNIAPVTTFYDNTPPSAAIDSVLYLVPNSIVIEFCEGFDDSVFLFINDKLIFSNYLQTNGSDGLTGPPLILPYDTSAKTLNLTIQFKKSKNIIKELLSRNFKLLEISRLESWNFYYSNHIRMRE